MDSDDLATVKALRKAKKKEIQAWITGFEQREGRPPDSRCAYCMVPQVETHSRIIEPLLIRTKCKIVWAQYT